MITFTLNGTPVAVDCPPTERLTEVLRDRLGSTGTKVGCDAGDCGAWTVPRSAPASSRLPAPTGDRSKRSRPIRPS